MGWFRLKVSHEDTIKTSAKATVICRLDWSWTVPLPSSDARLLAGGLGALLHGPLHGLLACPRDAVS